MAEQSIRFRIGSDFSGEGFTKARAAVGEVNKSARVGIEAAGKLASAMGGMDNAAGKCATAITGLMNAISYGTPVMAAVSVAITALVWGFNQLKAKEEELKKANEDLIKSNGDLLKTINDRIFKKATDDAKLLGDEYERITKHANEMTSAINALNNQNSENGILQLQADKIVAVMNEITDEGKQLVAAEYDLKIATQQAANMRTESEQNIRLAHQAVVDAEGKLANLQNQRLILEQEKIKMEENNKAIAIAEKSTREAVLKQIQDMQSKIEDVDKKILEGKQNLEVLQIKENTAIAKKEGVEIKATQTIEQATNKQKELNKTIDDRKIAEEQAVLDAEIAAWKAEERADKEKELSEIIKQGSEQQKKVNDSAQKLKIAQDNYTKALEEYQKNYAENKMNEAILNTPTDNMGQQNIDWGAVGRDIVNNGLEQAIKNGQAGTVKELNNIQKNLERSARDLQSQWKAQLGREKGWFDQLLNKNPKTWSQQDKDFYNKFTELSKKKNAAGGAVADAKQAYEEALRQYEAEKKQASNIQAIRDLLEEGTGIKK